MSTAPSRAHFLLYVARVPAGFYWSKLLNWFRTQNKTIVLANHSETISKINQSKLKSNMRTRLQAMEMPQAIDDRSMILCVWFFFYDFVFLLLIG